MPSNYKQVRITLTEQRDVCHQGRVVIGVRVMVKPLQSEWHQRQTILVSEVHDQVSIADLEGVYDTLLEFLRSPPLPGHIG